MEYENYYENEDRIQAAKYRDEHRVKAKSAAYMDFGLVIFSNNIPKYYVLLRDYQGVVGLENGSEAYLRPVAYFTESSIKFFISKLENAIGSKIVLADLKKVAAGDMQYEIFVNNSSYHAIPEIHDENKRKIVEDIRNCYPKIREFDAKIKYSEIINEED